MKRSSRRSAGDGRVGRRSLRCSPTPSSRASAAALSALYYADRLYQLPGGVIGIAVGTVLLPEMSRRLAAGDDAGARAARAIAFTLLLAILRRGVPGGPRPDHARCSCAENFAADAQAAAGRCGLHDRLIPFVLMRSFVATFLARGDTATTVKAALIAVAVNIALKIAFLHFTTLAQVGLALATSIGAWINLALILWFGLRAGFIGFDGNFRRDLGKLAVAGGVLAAALFVAQRPILALTAGLPGVHNVMALVLLGFVGAIVYAGAIFGLFGKAWLRAFFRGPHTKSSSAPPAPE